MAETAEESKNVCVLRASIHCEGCKRKVKKILDQVRGVDSVDVDTKQQKVTVTGSVDADTLIKKLAKSGKHAQLWPQKDDKVNKPPRNAGNNNTNDRKIIESIDHQQPNLTSDIAPKDSHPSPKVQSPVKDVSGERVGGPVKSAEGVTAESSAGGGGTMPAAKGESDAPTKTSSAGGVEKTTQKDNKNDVGGCSVTGEPPTVAVEKSSGGEGSGLSGKKKKKKGQRENRTERAAEPAENPVPGLSPSPNHIPPRHPHSPPQHHYYTPPPTEPVYAVSYNTAYPTSSNPASYYATPPPYSYAYTHPGPETYVPPSDLETNPRQPLDSFEIFSDENPNGCYVM